MSIQFGNLHVDEKYSRIIVPNLYRKTWIMPGITCQDVSSDNAGGVYFHKLGAAGVTVKAPGNDFADTAVSDTLVEAVFNNSIQASQKIYNVQAASVEMPIAEEELSLAINSAAVKKNDLGAACLIHEGTTSSTKTAITESNIVKLFLAERKELVKAGATPDTILCSPDVFACMLEAAGAKYLPETNEKVLAAAEGGMVGNYMGCRWIECPSLAETSIDYYDYSSTKQTVAPATLGVEFIMFDHNFLGIGDKVTANRIVDSENFAGCKAQFEDNVAFRVLNADAVRVKVNA